MSPKIDLARAMLSQGVSSHAIVYHIQGGRCFYCSDKAFEKWLRKRDADKHKETP